MLLHIMAHILPAPYAKNQYWLPVDERVCDPRAGDYNPETRRIHAMLGGEYQKKPVRY